MRKAFKHLVNLQARVSGFSVDQAKAFCLLCVERQKFAYDKTTTIVRSDDSIAARIYLDILWNKQTPTNNLPLLDAEFDAEDAAANFIYSVYEIDKIESKNVIGPCRVIAEMSMDILDSLAYSISGLAVNAANDEIIDAGLLISTEIARQEQDLRIVEAMAAAVDFDALKGNSRIDITLGTWFVG